MISALLLAALALAMLAGCGSEDGMEEGGGQSGTEKNLVVAANAGEDSLDPVYSYGSWYGVRYGVYETLFRLDESMTPQPWLAESCRNIDQYTWEIVIKEGITFSNGAALTAQKVLESLDYERQNNEMMADILKTAEMTAEGQTLTIVCQTPAPALIHNLCDPFCAVIDVAADTDFNTNPIGTGPFVVEEFQAKSLCRLRANEDYWDGPSPLDTVEIRVISETGTLATALRSGEIDAVIQGATADSVDQLEGDADYGTDICATSRVFLLMLNQNNEHLRNPTFRRALARAIDRGALCNDMLEGSAIPGAGTFPAELPYGDVSITGLEYDLEQARALLAQAGYVLEGERLTRDGEAVTLRIVTSTMRQELQLLAQGVASQLEQLGIETEIITSADDVRTVLAADEFDIGVYSRVAAATGDPYDMLASCYGTDGYANYGHYTSGQVDEMLSQLAAEFQTARRNELAVQIQQQVINDTGAIHIGHLNNQVLFRAGVTGLTAHPADFYQLTNQIDLE